MTETPGKHGKQWFSGQLKIALQGAGNRPEGALRITLFSWIPGYSGLSLCMPLSTSIRHGSCQERYKSVNNTLFSGCLFLCFEVTRAGCLDSGHCTHCSGIHCFPRVSRETVKYSNVRNQAPWQGKRRGRRKTVFYWLFYASVQCGSFPFPSIP